MRKLLFICLLYPFLAVAQTSRPSPNSFPIYPDSNWDRIVNPDDYGWDETKLKQLRSFIIDSTHTTGIMVVHSGKVLFEYGDVQELSYLASCRKSVLSML